MAQVFERKINNEPKSLNARPEKHAMRWRDDSVKASQSVPFPVFSTSTLMDKQNLEILYSFSRRTEREQLLLDGLTLKSPL